MSVRKEHQSDIDTIFEITKMAFADHPYSDHKEQLIVNALRDANALTLSLVSELEGHLVGHVAFSAVAVSDGSQGWYGLGPVSVLPACQRQGVGQALIDEGLRLLQTIGAKGCVVMGDPDYYQRFGFKTLPGLVYENVPPEYFLALPFVLPIPQGVVTYHQAFFVDE